MHPPHPLGDPRKLADDRELGVEAYINRANNFLGARKGRAPEQHNRTIDAAFSQAANILETRLSNPDDTAAQHGVRDLGHSASALGDAEDVDTG